MSASKSIHPITVLLVEDNPDDVELTREAFADARVRLELHVAQDGVEALEFLKNENNPRPELIMLDLNMPRKDGRETLDEIKKDPKLRRIPVLVLTTSEAEAYILTAYDMNANSYIVKPVDFDQFLNVMEILEEFWFTVVKLPDDN